MAKSSWATTARNYSFALPNGEKQVWSGFYSDVPSDIKIKGIEVALLGSISVALSAGIRAGVTWDEQKYADTGHTILWNDSSVQTSFRGDSENSGGRQCTANQLEGTDFGKS